MSQTLIAALQNPALYPHSVDGFHVIETHISWVLLTGEYAYKIKKPVNFGFLDFTSLAARQHFCEQELLLNQRLTQGLYLEVIGIGGDETTPTLDGSAPAFEYALKMRQFPQENLLSAIQARGELNQQHIDALAQQIAGFHARAPQVELSHPLGSADSVFEPVAQNFEQIRPMISEKADLQQLDALQAWAQSSFERLKPVLEQRKAQGFIRECHGDIHLGNVAVIDDAVVLFDCIEFNEPFRMIDVASDVAFLCMDLEDRGLKALSHRFLSNWLELSGDYDALQLINFYKAYRAMVRGKVSLFRLGQEQDPVQRAAILRQYRGYAALAESYSNIPTTFLAITHGVSGSGKSQVALRLVEALGAIRIRSDVERKRLFGENTADGALEQGIYSADATAQTYARLHQLAAQVLEAGFAVVLDATYLKQAPRAVAAQVAEQFGAPFLVIDCQAPEAVIEGWLNKRSAEGRDPSDAGIEVMHAQQASREPLTEYESARRGLVQTHEASSLDKLVEQIRQRLPGL